MTIITAKINKNATVETLDKRITPPKVVVRRVVGFIHGKRGGVLKVLYVCDDQLPTQSTTPTIWNGWKQEERKRKDGAAPVPAYRKLPIVKPVGEDEPVLSQETRDVLLQPVQRICINPRCRTVFKTRVVSVHHCPKCAITMAPTARRAEGGAA